MIMKCSRFERGSDNRTFYIFQLKNQKNSGDSVQGNPRFRLVVT